MVVGGVSSETHSYPLCSEACLSRAVALLIILWILTGDSIIKSNCNYDERNTRYKLISDNVSSQKFKYYKIVTKL